MPFCRASSFSEISQFSGFIVLSEKRNSTMPPPAVAIDACAASPLRTSVSAATLSAMGGRAQTTHTVSRPLRYIDKLFAFQLLCSTTFSFRIRHRTPRPSVPGMRRSKTTTKRYFFFLWALWQLPHALVMEPKASLAASTSLASTALRTSALPWRSVFVAALAQTPSGQRPSAIKM